MKHIAHLVLALALVLVAARDSSASPPSATAVVFEAVDAVTVRGDEYIKIEGLVQGEATPRTIQFQVAYPPSSGSGSGLSVETCHKQAMLVLTHPGRYSLEFDYRGGPAECTIRRR